jgi:ABC-type transporter Mla subunit MlaD
VRRAEYLLSRIAEKLTVTADELIKNAADKDDTNLRYAAQTIGDIAATIGEVLDDEGADQPLTLDQKYTAVTAMQNHGGSFIKMLAGVWRSADPYNRAKIEQAWADEFERYAAWGEAQ